MLLKQELNPQKFFVLCLYVFKHNSHNRYMYMYLKPLSQKLNLVINDTNDFLKNLNELRVFQMILFSVLLMSQDNT